VADVDGTSKDVYMEMDNVILIEGTEEKGGATWWGRRRKRLCRYVIINDTKILEEVATVLSLQYRFML
jgi:hypothetical protein